MKYTIEGFSQQAAQDLGLKATDLIILRWFTDFSATQKMKRWIVGGKIYYWISYSAVREALPILDVGEQQLRKNVFPRLVEAKVLTHKTFKKKDGQGGTFAAYGFGEKYSLLVENEQGFSKTGQGNGTGIPKGNGTGIPSKDSSIIVTLPSKVTMQQRSNGFAVAECDENEDEVTDGTEDSGQHKAELECFDPGLEQFVDFTYPTLFAEYKGYQHPRLKPYQRIRTLTILRDYLQDYTEDIDALEAAAEEFISDGESDGKILAFANPDVIEYRLVRQGF